MGAGIADIEFAAHKGSRKPSIAQVGSERDEIHLDVVSRPTLRHRRGCGARASKSGASTRPQAERKGTTIWRQK
jgi:hypothetical protein